MRYYEPAGVERVLAQILAEPSLAGGVVHRSTIPARTADFVPMPEWLDPRIVAASEVNTDEDRAAYTKALTEVLA